MSRFTLNDFIFGENDYGNNAFRDNPMTKLLLPKIWNGIWGENNDGEANETQPVNAGADAFKTGKTHSPKPSPTSLPDDPQIVAQMVSAFLRRF